MQGEHKADYRRPRTGEKRHTRQPLLIDRLPEEIRGAILKARAEGKTWQETAEWASKKAGKLLHVSLVHRWYDIRVEQANKESIEQLGRAQALAKVFASKGFADLPRAALNALAAEVFAVMEAGGAEARQQALGNLVLAISKLVTAQAKHRLVEIEKQKIELANKKFDELRSKAEKATNEAAAKLGKGGQLTIADINRIRERALGLPPVAAGPAA